MPLKKITHRIRHHARRAHVHLKNHFIPHEGNGHRPYALRHKALLIYSVSLITVKLVLVLTAIFLPSSSLFSSAITPGNVIDLTNKARTQASLVSLTTNAALSAAAQAKADDMLTKQYFAHTSPDGATPWTWIRAQGYSYLHAGENLAVHFVSTEDVQGGWMASPEHKANIVNPQFTEIGVGVASGVFEQVPSIFVVQMFGTPAPQKPKEIAAFDVLREEATSKPPTSVTSTKILGVAINQPNIRIREKTKTKSYNVTIANATATAMQLVFNAETHPMQKTENGTWQADVPFTPSTIPAEGEPLQAIAYGPGRQLSSETLAVLSPSPDVRPFFLGSQWKEPVKLFHLFTLEQANDSARIFYLAIMSVLIALFLINVFVKFHVQKVSLVSHTLGVICLTMVLTVL